MRWLWQMISRRRRYDELAESMREYMDEKIDVLMCDGMSRGEAERAARIAFGNQVVIEERSREVWQWPVIDGTVADLRYALRHLRKAPGFSAVVILSLAVGIGATTSMFSLMYAVLLHPVPYADWQRLTYPSYYNDDQPGSPVWWFSLSWLQFEQLRHARSIEDVVGSTNVRTAITGGDSPEDVTLTYITENVDEALRVPALLGRNIQRSDAEAAAGAQPVVLSFDFWMRHFNGDRDVVNRTLEIDRKPFVIVGVMPRDYAWERDMYTPMAFLPTRERISILPVMKLKPGVSLGTADAEIGALLHEFAKTVPDQFPLRFRMHLEHITDRIVTNAGRTLVLLAVAVLVLLIIGCANCSILLLARGISRDSELALRAALGATRSRIVRQLLMESLLLAVAGSVVGIGLAFWMARLIFGLFPDVFMHESVIRINLPILGFSTVLALVSGVLFGLMPSLRISRPELAQTMQSIGRKVAGRIGGTDSLNWLIGAQIALTVVLMGSAGAAIGGFMKMTHRDFGYDPAHLMSVAIPIHRHSLLTREHRAAYIESLKQRVATVPGVTQVAVSADATPPESGENRPFQIRGVDFAQEQFVRIEFTDAEYFSTLRIPLLQGRLWDGNENVRGAAVCVINETMARRYFPKGNAIGRQIRMPELEISPANVGELVGVPDTTGWMQVIGVVADTLDDGLDKPVLPALYTPHTRFMWEFTQLLVRTDGPPLASLHAVEAAIQQVNSDQQVGRTVRDLQQWIDSQPEVQQQRLFSILFGLFSSLALALALVGLYSVVSYLVAQRTNEFGIRMALGAQRSHVFAIVSGRVGVTVGSGLTGGIIIFLAIHGLLVRLAQNSEFDPLILIGVIALFGLSAALACTVPVLRATSIDPMHALRAE